MTEKDEAKLKATIAKLKDDKARLSAALIMARNAAQRAEEAHTNWYNATRDLSRLEFSSGVIALRDKVWQYERAERSVALEE